MGLPFKNKKLNINDFFDRKYIIEYLETLMTGALKKTSKTDSLELAEESDVDEAITAEAKDNNEMKNDLNDEQNTKAYEDKMNIDIENINTI